MDRHRKYVLMSYPFDRFEITDDTDFEVENGSLTIEEQNWLRENGVLKIRGHHTETGTVSTAELDIKKLAQIAFEYDLLREVASSIDVEILDTFRRSDDRTLTTAEITRELDRPKSSVSRALTRLSEKGKLIKVQAGVYRYP